MGETVSINGDGESVTFSHEVWSNDTYCPVHGVSPVGVEIIEDGGGNGGNGGNGSNLKYQH